MAVQGKRVLVTGASQGIGRALAWAFAQAGSRLALAGRREQVLADMAEQMPGAVTVHPLELGDFSSIGALVEELAPGVDILVNCGGIYAAGAIGVVEPGDFPKMMAVNVLGPYELTRQLLPGIIANRGQVVFINSSIVRCGGPETGQYAATQHALRAIADSLRAEVNPRGVRVLSVFPGRTATPRQTMIFARESRRYDPAKLLQPEDIASTVIHSLNLPATAELMDVWIRPAENFAPK